jgi:hypothetical protein
MIELCDAFKRTSGTHGYATPATPNAQWSRPTLCGYQNQPCIPSSYQSGYLFPYPTWENPKPRFWHFEPWFPKVLEISENTLLYITSNSFGSWGVGSGRFLYPPLVWWERDAIRPSFLPFGWLQCFVETVCTRKPWWFNPRHKLTPVARCFTGLSLPHPPKPPSDWLTNRQTNVVN